MHLESMHLESVPFDMSVLDKSPTARARLPSKICHAHQVRIEAKRTP
jgi:hypothetical protein